MSHVPDLLTAARAWAADDPDPTTADELLTLVASAEAGDTDAQSALTDAMAGLLEFGTAGLHGADQVARQVGRRAQSDEPSGRDPRRCRPH